MDELKACPFCGAELDKHGCLTRNGVVTDYYIHPAPDEVRDDECPLCGCVFRAATWNRRPLEDALQAEIERLREAQRWIPVGERLPEDFDDVLVIVGTKYRHIMYRQSGCWWKHGWPQDGADVTHWMPLPEPLHEA